MKKTIYGPCPVGYKVPVSDADGNTPYAWMKFTEMTWDPTNHGAIDKDQWLVPLHRHQSVCIGWS